MVLQNVLPDAGTADPPRGAVPDLSRHQGYAEPAEGAASPQGAQLWNARFRSADHRACPAGPFRSGRADPVDGSPDRGSRIRSAWLARERREESTGCPPARPLGLDVAVFHRSHTPQG